jgi:5'-AMP-activated protein kinase catalytic alpha subunit
VQDYDVMETIGEGTFGKVKKGIHKLTNIPVAIKILEKERIVDGADVERVKREIHILTRVQHPNIIRLFEVIDSPRHIFLIMNYLPGGELFDHIVSKGRVNEKDARAYFHDIVNGVDYCHQNNIIHRDLKPENLLLDNDRSIIIVDFGLGNTLPRRRQVRSAIVAFSWFALFGVQL